VPVDLPPEIASEPLPARLAALEVELAEQRKRADSEQARADALVKDLARLKKAYEQALLDLKLLRQRLFVAKAERADTTQLEMEFAKKAAELEHLVAQIGQGPGDGAGPPEKATEPPSPSSNPSNAAQPPSSTTSEGAHAPPPPPKSMAKSKGRRRLADLPLPEERIELTDPELEGNAERAGFESSYKLGYRKGGPIRIVLARAKYRTEPESSQVPELSSRLSGKPAETLSTTPLPAQLFPRCLAAPSLLAKILVDKYCDGLPFYRQEQRLEREGIDLDRGTMSRWAEDVGMTLGAVVLAMRQEAIETAFCMATDATGVAIQPEPTAKRGPCRRGHFFVLLADRDHVLFEYVARETSAAVETMFRGYSGYIQADAKSVYDVLFRRAGTQADDDRAEERVEVGCWAHSRRKFWEAAIDKDPIAREGLFRIHRLYELEKQWKSEPPDNRKRKRQEHSRPEVDAFFTWAQVEYDKVKDTRGLRRSALGYVIRQEQALRRFLEDGRLRLDNNPSELALRHIAVGRKAWLFFGSDDHAEAAANLFSLISSCRLHGLDSEAYLRDLIRVLPHWPRERYLELAPRYWNRTRARLDARELELALGPLTVPQPSAE